MFDDMIRDRFVTRDPDTRDFFTIANMISLLRILLTVPALWCFAADRWIWGMVILGICVISDWADGFVARKTHSVSHFGKVIDPFADKVVAIAMMLLMVIKMDFPLYFVIVLALRDLSIFIIGNMLYRRRSVVGGANIAGKVFIVVLTVAGVLWLLEYYLGILLYAEIVLYIAFGLMLLSWGVYLVQNVKMLTYKG